MSPGPAGQVADVTVDGASYRLLSWRTGQWSVARRSKQAVKNNPKASWEFKLPYDFIGGTMCALVCTVCTLDARGNVDTRLE
jgi:hypothetical protein